jgi:hypothetical protein
VIKYPAYLPNAVDLLRELHPILSENRFPVWNQALNFVDESGFDHDYPYHPFMRCVLARLVMFGASNDLNSIPYDVMRDGWNVQPVAGEVREYGVWEVFIRERLLSQKTEP